MIGKGPQLTVVLCIYIDHKADNATSLSMFNGHTYGLCHTFLKNLDLLHSWLNHS